MSNTPRTKKEEYISGGRGSMEIVVPVNFARRLELEIDTWKDMVKTWQDISKRKDEKLGRFRAALFHIQSCKSCAEGSWEDCEGGRKALDILSDDTAN